MNATDTRRASSLARSSSVVGRTLTVNATISNYGFAAPVHPRPVLVTLQGGKWPGDAKVVWYANVSGTPAVACSTASRYI